MFRSSNLFVWASVLKAVELAEFFIYTDPTKPLQEYYNCIRDVP